MKLPIKLIILLTMLVFKGIAQDSAMIRKQPPKQRFLDKIYIGGNLGLHFDNETLVELSPLVGYKINDKISAGVGITYKYYHYRDAYYDFQTEVYGGGVFGRYMFTDYLFGHAEYEYLNLEAFDFQRRRVDVGSLMAGGGYIQRFGRNSGIVAMILYNFTESAYTPYQNPIIRIGLNIGL